VSTALLVEYYNELIERQVGTGASGARRQRQQALKAFRTEVAQRYNEGTLLRLLESPGVRTRRAALLALGQLGTMTAVPAVALRLHDEETEIHAGAVEALWAIWFRADGPAHNEELQRLLRLRDHKRILAGLDQLIKDAPTFAEAYNQRAILAFKLKQYDRSIADCERVLELNPYHFGAQAGMAQCFLQLRKHKAALKAFRNALRLNPRMDGVAETIRALENALGEEGRKDDKK
jgi:tetratricopeptide (TPR) repeat protein